MSQVHTISPDEAITYAPEHRDNTKHIWRTFWILTIVTLIELALGYWIYRLHSGGTPSPGLVLFLKGLIVILTLVKAYYIVAVFMHLGDEIRNFTMTIVLPLLLFIWFIIAFIMDGASWGELRNTDGLSKPDTHQAAPHTVPAQGARP